MAVYKIFPEKDTTIYNQYIDMNSGIDEILEFGNNIGADGTTYAARTLIKFSQTELDDVIENLIGTSSFDVNLKLYAAKVSGLNRTVSIETYPVSSSWTQGTGQYQDSPQTQNGASWTWSSNSGSTKWTTNTYNYFTTASFPQATPGGGTWYTGSYLGLSLRSTASLGYRTSLDLTLPVLNIVKNWYSASIGQTGLINDGFIIKQTRETEFNTDSNLDLKYFSADTNTIYPPCLEFKWDDSTYITSSNIPTVSSDDIVVSISNGKTKYLPDTTVLLRLHTRPQNPPRIFSTSSIYTQNYYLPSTTYYSLQDAHTSETVITFDEQNTKVSADLSGNFIKLYTSGLQPERYYQLTVKTVINNSIQTVPVGEPFKIENV